MAKIDDRDIFDRLYDATCLCIDRNKNIIGGLIFVFIMIWFGRCCFEPDECNESIIDLTSTNHECYNGAKLKQFHNIWMCVCEK